MTAVTNNQPYSTQQYSATSTGNTGASQNDTAAANTLSAAVANQPWGAAFTSALDNSSLVTGVAGGSQQDPFADMSVSQIQSAKNVLWNALSASGQQGAWNDLYSAGLTGDQDLQQQGGAASAGGTGGAGAVQTGTSTTTSGTYGTSTGTTGQYGTSIGTTGQYGTSTTTAATSTTTSTVSAPNTPGTLPPADMNGQGQAFQVPGLAQNKALVMQACLANGITDPTRQAQIMASGLLEGNLNTNTDPKCIGPFNLNTGLLSSLGMSSLGATIANTGDLPASINASVQVINAALNKGTDYFTSFQRGGSSLNADPVGQAGTYQYASYQAAFNNTVSYLQSGSGLTDDYRYAENVPAV